MLRSNPNVQNQYEFVCIEELVLPNHPLRKIQKYIDFSFILELVRPYYCEDNGRPSADPKCSLLAICSAFVRSGS